MTVRTALFDLDGTLTDSRPGILASLRAALRDLGHTPDPAEDLTWVVGPPIEDVMGRLLAPCGDDRTLEATALYRQHYAAGGLFDNAPYPGIPEALTAFAASGFSLFVATAKRTRFARRILAHFGMEAAFAGIYGTEDSGEFNRKSDLIAHILRQEKIAAQGTIMIGDRLHDIEAAHANALPAIGVAWGYGGRAELTKAGADALADRPAQLLPLALPLFQRRELQSGKLA